MAPARFTVVVDGVSYIIKDGTFVEGAVRRQAEFPYLGDQDLKSRPDTRDFLHNSWIGGAQWEKPVYGRNNEATYFESSDLSFTDRSGAIQATSQSQRLDSDLQEPSVRLAAWSEDGVDGAVTIRWNSSSTWEFYEWDASTDDWVASGSTITEDSSATVFAMTGGVDKVWVLFDDGDLYWYDPTAGTDGKVSTVSVSISNGAAMWVDRDYVYIYNGDKVYKYDIGSGYAETTVADDDWGLDAFSRSASFSGKPIIPEWSCTRAVTTSEGVFYVKNVFEGGLVVAKVFRIDHDASGKDILTPIGTLPKGHVAVNLTSHLGSLLVSTVSSFQAAVANTDDQRVTMYHVTGKSIGAVGSPLGGTNIDETPVWFLGTYDEQLFFGGRRAIWQYDARVGAYHEFMERTLTKYTNHGGGWSQMASVDTQTGPGLLFTHCSQDGTNAVPYIQLMVTDTRTTSSNDNAFVTSNWFDFEKPLELKSIYELYYDMENLRDDSTITIAVSADGGAFSTVKTLAHTDADTGRVAITAVRGYKFQYRVTFNTDTDTSSSDPSAVLAIGFSAIAGDMVDVIQFTIDGDETLNMENAPAVPVDVYNNLATLRDKRTEVVVVHTYSSHESDVTVSATYYVTSVTGRKGSPFTGEYDVILTEVAT